MARKILDIESARALPRKRQTEIMGRKGYVDHYYLLVKFSSPPTNEQLEKTRQALRNHAQLLVERMNGARVGLHSVEVADHDLMAAQTKTLKIPSLGDQEWIFDVVCDGNYEIPKK